MASVHHAIVPAALAFAGALVLAAHVVLRRERSQLDGPLLTLLGALMVWTAGSVFRFSVESLEGLHASLRVVFLGVFATPPLWLLVASRYARAPALLNRRNVMAGLMVPSALAYLALLTNEGHHLVIREVSFHALESGGLFWAGPVFWAFIAWSYACVLGGAALYLDTARRLVANAERRRAILLAIASVIPILASALYLFRLMPVSFDLTPASLTVSLALISVAVFRYQLLESLPLARRDVIEHLRDGVVMANAAGVILDTNPVAARILGQSPDSLRNQHLDAVLTGCAAGPSARWLEGALTQLAPGSPPLVVELLTTDERCIEVSAACVSDGDGRAAGRFAVLRDRTEERRYERVVRQSQKAQTMGTLASGIAHEVNNPLAFIRANLGQIQRMGELVEERRGDEGADAKLAEELADLATITEETLDGIGRIERIVAGMRRLAAEPEETNDSVDVNEVVRDALRLANLHRSPGITLNTRLADALPRVLGAPERLVQAVLNLLVNARQALDTTPGEIVVDTGTDGETVEIRVSDDGPGVPEHIRERIFDPFFTTKGPDRGTGLGLAIAFEILRDHDGVLELHPTTRAGACFSARLPIRRG